MYARCAVFLLCVAAVGCRNSETEDTRSANDGESLGKSASPTAEEEWEKFKAETQSELMQKLEDSRLRQYVLLAAKSWYELPDQTSWHKVDIIDTMFGRRVAGWEAAPWDADASRVFPRDSRTPRRSEPIRTARSPTTQAGHRPGRLKS